MKKNKLLLTAFALSLVLLVGCAPDTKDKPVTDGSINPPVENMDDMVHDTSGEIPQGLKESAMPNYKVGDSAKILTEHMEGMKGAEATIVGAFDTIAYEISYDPTNGDSRVENHKWVIHEEIKNAGTEELKPGDEVIIEASHMEGMKDATATIEAAEATTVYMVDYEPNTGGEKVKNHKWVTDSELSGK